MKRRLVPRADDDSSATVSHDAAVDKRGCQIHPLGGDPTFQTLTPRTHAKSVAELDALRSRVLALELQLSQNEVDATLLAAQHKSVGKKLPPISMTSPLQTATATTAGVAGDTSAVSSDPSAGTNAGAAADNTASSSLAYRIATAPVHSTTRRALALTLPASASSHKPSIASPLALATLSVSDAQQTQQQPLVSPSQPTMHPSQSVDAIQPPPVAAVERRSSGTTNGARHASGELTIPASTSQSTNKRLGLSRSLTGLATVATSPPRAAETKITLGLDDRDGKDATVVVAVSQRQRLYEILKRVSAIASIQEDELVLLKKFVDAEISDVLTVLFALEHEQAPLVITDKLAQLLTTGSPSKHQSAAARIELLPRQHPVWGIQYPLQKIARNLEQLRSGITNSTNLTNSPTKRLDVIVLAASGAYNPVHMLHIRAFYVARQYVEANYKFPVVGAFFSPSHDTYVRVKNRRNPREMITKRHRLALLEAAVAPSTWIEVDKWEITRRRVLDYLSTLTHVREMCESHFPGVKFHVMYVCGVNTVVKLSHAALRDDGFGCITVCRPTQTEMVIKQLGKQLAKTTTIVEDTGVLPCELERATSFRVRKALATTRHLDAASAATVELMVGKPVFHYLCKHDIGAKIAGRESWTDDDKHWRDVDRPYVEYIEC